MRRLAAVAGVALVAWVGVPGVAFAAPFVHEHFRDAFSIVDPDFCGTGVAIDIELDIVDNIAFDPDEPFFQSSSRVLQVFTNPDTEDTVRVLVAQRLTSRLVENPNGTFTAVDVIRGVPEQIKSTRGPLLLRDAGVITFSVTFDVDGNVLSEDISWTGPHPEADSGFTAFCDVMTEALGIA